MNKFEEVIYYISDLIETKQLKSNDPLPSEGDLIARFKVSRHTIRKALAKLSTQGLIIKQQGKKAYVNPNLHLINRKRVAVLTTYISDYIFPTIISGIEEVLSQNNCSMILSSTNNNKELEATQLEYILHDVDGLIIEPTQSANFNSNEALFNELKKKDIPVVFLNATYENFDAPSLVMDDYNGARKLTNLLNTLNHTNIFCVLKTDDAQGINRLKGIKDELKTMKIKLGKENIFAFNSDLYSEVHKSATKQLLKLKDRPTAIFCYNDKIASLMISELEANGYKIPEDFSVVGFDDAKIASYYGIGLSTVAHPKKKMGIDAANMMLRLLDNQVVYSQVYEPELILRKSVSINHNK